MTEAMFDPLSPDEAKSGSAARADGVLPKWQPLVPVPSNAPPPPGKSAAKQTPSLIHEYRDAAGALLGYVYRIDSDGARDFYPLTYCEERGSGRRGWRWQSWPVPRPLYGLDRLAARPDAPIVVCEGEKATDAATRLATDHVAVTSPSGSNAARKADWSPLKGRKIVIWPDADEAGERYAASVTEIVKAFGSSVRIMTPPSGVAAGWDAADALADGWTPKRTAELIAGASEPAEEEPSSSASKTGANQGENKGSAPKRRKPGLMHYMGDDVEFWHDLDGRPYVTAPIGTGNAAHYENYELGSHASKIWLSLQGYQRSGQAPSAKETDDVVRTMAARAIHSGRAYQTWRRVGEIDGNIVVDLGDAVHRAVVITALGWKVQDRSPVKFLRSSASRALPEPEAGYSLADEFRPLLPEISDSDFRLLSSCLVAACHPAGPFPILALNGEQGSGKSFFSRLVRSLLDPNASPIRAYPENPRDFVITAENNWCICIDNVSGLPGWLSDALCRVSTGSGYATRELHSDRDEAVFQASRFVLLNGIPDLSGRPDLQDRAITLTLPQMEESKRKTEKDALAAFEAAAPRILGALYDGVSASLRNLADVKLDHLPRMADFARLAVAAAPGLGWTGDEFLADYSRSRATAVALSLESMPLAAALQELAVERSESYPWQGTASDLLKHINGAATDDARKSKSWPKTAAELGSQVRRLQPSLRAVGIDVEVRREGHNRVRMIRIFYRPEAAP